jgi:hypothetical protein
MLKREKKIPTQSRKEEKAATPKIAGLSNSEMIEYLKTLGLLLDQTGSEYENVEVA